MPFLAYRNEMSDQGKELVVPEEVADSEDVECPSCGGRMRPRGGGPDQRARHFFHVRSTGGTSQCYGAGNNIAESERHRVMKSLAVSGLRRRFTGVESIDQCSTEIPIDVSGSQGRSAGRRADALVEFASRNRFFGEGVIVEVQHANESKNIPQVTADYLDAGYSVMWADESCFSKDEFLIQQFNSAFNEDGGRAFSPYRHSSQRIWSEFDPSEWFSTPDGWQFEDPNPDCSHEFQRDRGDAKCLLCGTQYQLHSESQFPMFSPGDRSQMHIANITYVRGADDALEPDGTPHVHIWSPENRGERSTVSTCSRCRAKKISSKSETVIDYNAHSFEQLETPEMQHCDHEWRRTGSGEECWKCGKPKGDDGMGMYF